MQKTGLIIVIFGLLIVVGIGTSVVENQVTLEGINQGNGKVNSEQIVSISVNLDKNETPVGIFAVQVMEFKENTFSAKILDPLGIEIISEKINEDTIEQEFKVFDSGNYELIIKSSDDKESYVAGAIGPLPDGNKKLIISTISSFCIIIGMGGLVILAIYEIRNKRKSV
ncbi:MAG: hypothetical protein O2834_01900 [Crenarchaeota archaeon]|nr:hypothetical protein [Thermoproteota archaeon]HJJ20813.1 hypothetical protein [Nitrosopumilus sp.]MDA0853617.1 hypothetical protein [Thermoproteota archaeon]MDA1122970.1 hypothetical protein [Thermoproteota archaeon]HJJ23970.1 hypothetical protein [Nitrosopumilus sp.]